MIIVDRIEEGFAICESDDRTVDIPLAEIAGAVKEGDVLRSEGLLYIVDTDETERRRSGIQDRFNRLKNRRA